MGPAGQRRGARAGGSRPRGLREAGTRAGRLRSGRAGWAEREVWAEPVWRGLGRAGEVRSWAQEKGKGFAGWAGVGFGFGLGWVFYFLFLFLFYF